MNRHLTGVPGLDTILGGGVFQGGIYILQGAPGSGKTILANQFCFEHARTGGRALYVTLLAENHSRLLGHLKGFSFFDESRIPEHVNYLSGFKILEDEGLKGLVDTLRREIRARKSTLLILDGLVSAEESASSPRELKKFINELQTQASLTNCTIFLLTSAYMSQRLVSAEHTMVDGLVELQSRLQGRRSEREMQVQKFRGGPSLRGVHSFEISDAGVEVFPRIEALLRVPRVSMTMDGEQVTSGLAGLDNLLGGGPTRHSGTLLMGPAGIGKTTFGLHFLGEDPGVLLSFSETAEALQQRARRLGLKVAGSLERGETEVIWQPATEGNVDELCQRLLSRLTAVGARRLVLDGMDGFQKITGEPERIGPLLTALMNQVRSLGITTLASVETDLAGIVPGQPLAGLAVRDLSPLADNLVILRLASAGGTLHRLITVLKARDARTDLKFRRFNVSETGIVIESSPNNAAMLMSETPSTMQPLGLAPDVPDDLGRGG